MKSHFKLLVAFAAILAARVLGVYSVLWMAQVLGEKIPSSWNKILAFAGLRGAVLIALVLSLPDSNFKGTIQAMIFGLALLSLIVQAEILQVYLRKATTEEESQQEFGRSYD